MAYFPTELISHTRRVCSLYKRVVRNLESWNGALPDFRYKAVLMRARFEGNRNIKDMRVAQKLLQDGEEELFNNMHPQPKIFVRSPRGLLHERYIEPPDWVLDFWHPLERAQYPHYFAVREQRKKEYVEMWEREYGKPSANDLKHH